MAIPTGVPDDALLTRARDGDTEAFEVLYHRHHRTARRAAHRYSPRNPLAEDAVQEAFLRILRATQQGAGPRREFAGYVATTVRHVLAGWARADRSVASDDDEDLVDEQAPGPESRLRWHLLVRSFRSLPTRWQEALWLGEVEGLGVAELAERWDMTPSAASALTYRARDGLRTAWLEAHLATDRFPPSCRPYAVDLARWNRERLGPARSTEVAAHVAGCEDCRGVVAELDGVRRGFGVVLLPVAVWGGWLGAGTGAGVGSLLGKAGLRFAGQSPRRAVVVGSSVSAAAVVAVVGLTGLLSPPPVPVEPGGGAITSAPDRPSSSAPTADAPTNGDAGTADEGSAAADDPADPGGAPTVADPGSGVTPTADGGDGPDPAPDPTVQPPDPTPPGGAGDADGGSGGAGGSGGGSDDGGSDNGGSSDGGSSDGGRATAVGLVTGGPTEGAARTAGAGPRTRVCPRRPSPSPRPWR